MRVLFTTFASRTHVHTQVPLAWALRSAGHDVCVASHPDAVDDITYAGLTAVPVGEPLDQEGQIKELDRRRNEAQQVNSDAPEALDYMELTDISELRPEILTYDYVQTKLIAITMGVFQTQSSDRMIDDLLRFARGWRPDLVIWDTMTFAGPVVAIATGAAHARLLFGLDLVGRIRETYRELLRWSRPEQRDDPMAEWLGWTLQRYGCEFTEEAVVGQWTIDPIPTSMRLPVDHHYVPVRYVPYNGPAMIPDWLREPPKRPRVCLTLGRSFREILGGDKASIGDLLAAVSDSDIEVVATFTAEALADLPQVPDNVRAAGFVPLDPLLPSCSAIIHHGGSGTVLTALAHGVPQIMIPTRIWCNIPKAHQIQEAGAGLYREAGELSPDELRSMLLRVLAEPSFAENATRVRREMLGTPTPQDIVPVLERLTAEYQAAPLRRRAHRGCRGSISRQPRGTEFLWR